MTNFALLVRRVDGSTPRSATTPRPGRFLQLAQPARRHERCAPSIPPGHLAHGVGQGVDRPLWIAGTPTCLRTLRAHGKAWVCYSETGVPDVWRHKTGGHKPNGHPAEKPVGLVSRILTTTGLGAGAHILPAIRVAAAQRPLQPRRSACAARSSRPRRSGASSLHCVLDQGVLDLRGRRPHEPP